MTDPKTKNYLVTEHAGPRIDGKRVNAGDTIEMTEKQAQALLVTGALEDPDAPKKDIPPKEPENGGETPDDETPGNEPSGDEEQNPGIEPPEGEETIPGTGTPPALETEHPKPPRKRRTKTK